MQVKYKKLSELAKEPFHASEFSAGYDLFAAIEKPIVIAPHTNKKIGTGLAFEIPNGYWAGIFARSGLATKRGGRPANCVGVCESDYRGEYIVALYNDSNEDLVIEPGERIAQLIFVPAIQAQFQEEKNLSETERGSGGFGHSGR